MELGRRKSEREHPVVGGDLAWGKKHRAEGRLEDENKKELEAESSKLKAQSRTANHIAV